MAETAGSATPAEAGGVRPDRHLVPGTPGATVTASAAATDKPSVRLWPRVLLSRI